MPIVPSMRQRATPVGHSHAAIIVVAVGLAVLALIGGPLGSRAYAQPTAAPPQADAATPPAAARTPDRRSAFAGQKQPPVEFFAGYDTSLMLRARTQGRDNGSLLSSHHDLSVGVRLVYSDSLSMILTSRLGRSRYNANGLRVAGNPIAFRDVYRASLGATVPWAASDNLTVVFGASVGSKFEDNATFADGLQFSFVLAFNIRLHDDLTLRLGGALTGRQGTGPLVRPFGPATWTPNDDLTLGAPPRGGPTLEVQYRLPMVVSALDLQPFYLALSLRIVDQDIALAGTSAIGRGYLTHSALPLTLAFRVQALGAQAEFAIGVVLWQQLDFQSPGRQTIDRQVLGPAGFIRFQLTVPFALLRSIASRL